MAGVIKAAIVFALSNYSLTFLVVGLLFSIFAIARARNPLGQAVVVEKLLAWHVFWAIGVGYLYNFVMHAFFGQMSAAFIGWADSPFQFEVAMASLVCRSGLPRRFSQLRSSSCRHRGSRLRAFSCSAVPPDMYTRW